MSGRSKELSGATRLCVVFLVLQLCFYSDAEWMAGVRAVGFRGNSGTVHIQSETSSQAEGYVRLLRTRGIGKIRLHDANSDLLQALGKEESVLPSIEVVVGLPNDEIVDVGSASPASAHHWIARNVIPYFPRTKIVAVAVGNDVLNRQSSAVDNTLIPFLLPAMENIRLALSSVGLEKLIKVTAPQSMMTLSDNSPPSAVLDEVLYMTVMSQLLMFLQSSRSLFIFNLHPVDVHPSDDDGGLRNIDLFNKSFVSLAGIVVDEHPNDLHRVSFPHGEIELLVSSLGPSTALGSQVDIIDNVADLLEHGVELVVGGEDLVRQPESIRKGDFEDLPVKRQPESTLNGGVEDLVMNRQIESTSNGDVEDLVRKRAPESTSNGNVVRRRKLANKSWCVANADANTEQLQNSLDFACGPNMANCAPIQQGGSCFLPNTLVAHASYAFNSYYQKMSWAPSACDFGGTAHITNTDPSTPTCLYASSTSSNGTPSTPTGTIIPSVGNATSLAAVWNLRLAFVSTFLLRFLLYGTLKRICF